MKIKKFEAYKYSGPQILKLTRKDVIEQIIDNLTNSKIGGYECDGTKYNLNDECVFLYLDKIVGDKSVDSKTIKLDFSDMGIEIGTTIFDEGGDDDFIAEINLDTDLIKHLKTYKKNLKKYNL